MEVVNNQGRWGERRGQSEHFVVPSSKFFITAYLTRGISLMKLFFWFSFTLCSLLPKSLPFYLYLYSSVPCIHCAYLAFSYLFPSVSSLMALFFCPSSPLTSHPILSMFLSPQGGLSHRGRHSKRRFRL